MRSSEPSGTDSDAGEQVAALASARALADAGRMTEAVSQLRAITLRWPANVAAHIELGRLSQRDRQWTDAVAAWSAVLARDADNFEARLRLGNALLQLGRLDQAGAAAETAAKLRPSDPAARIALARVAHRRKDWGEAARQWRLALDGDPDNFEALLRGGEALASLAEREAADALFQRAQEKDPAHRQPPVARARMWHTAAVWSRAERSWRNALEREPDSEEVLIRLCEALASQGRLEEADAVLETGSPPAIPGAAVVRARLAHRARQWMPALQRWRACYDADSYEINHRLGEALWRLGRTDEATEPLRRAATLGPSESLPHLLLAHCGFAAGSAKAARRHAWRAWRLGGRTDALALVFRIYRATDQDDVAERLLRRAERRLDAGAAAEILIAAGAWDRAEARLAAVPAGDPGAENALRLLADLALRRGRYGAAARYRPTPLRDALADLDRLFARHDENIDAAFIGYLARAVAVRPAPSYAARPNMVLHAVNSLAAGGTERQAALTAVGLHRTFPEIEAHVIGQSLLSGANGFFHSFLEQNGVAATETASYPQPAELDGILATLSALGPFSRERLRTRYVLGIAAAIRHHRPAVVHAWGIEIALLAGMAGVICGVPKIILRMGSVAPPTRGALDDAERDRHDFYREGFRWLTGRPGVHFVANAQAVLDDFRAWLADDLPHSGVIGNGTEFPARRARPRPQALRHALGIPDDCLVVGGVFRLQREKDPLLWVRAAAALANRRQDVHFVLVGDGVMTERVRRAVRLSGLASRVHLPGRIADRLSEFYAAMDVFLLTSRFEGLPNVLLEAQHHGVPVVAKDVGGVAEAVLPGRTAVLVAGDDPSAYADALDSVIGDAEFRAAARRAGPRFVARHYSVRRMIERTVEIYGRDLRPSAP